MFSAEYHKILHLEKLYHSTFPKPKQAAQLKHTPKLYAEPKLKDTPAPNSFFIPQQQISKLDYNSVTEMHVLWQKLNKQT